LPVVDSLAAEYSDRVDFVAAAWHSTFELTKERADQLFVSRQIQWGLDEDIDIFEKYGVSYQPVTVLIAGDKTVVDSWGGIRSEEDIRASLDELIALSA
jgi:hypothetical protein